MAKEEKITLDAVVKEALPDTRFMVELENGQEVVSGWSDIGGTFVAGGEPERKAPGCFYFGRPTLA